MPNNCTVSTVLTVQYSTYTKDSGSSINSVGRHRRLRARLYALGIGSVQGKKKTACTSVSIIFRPVLSACKRVFRIKMLGSFFAPENLIHANCVFHQLHKLFLNTFTGVYHIISLAHEKTSSGVRS